jgi:transcriptional regulator with XRE-family HTH domain
MNVNELKGKITARGLTIQAFCDQFGFVRSTFDRKLNGPSEFDRDEIERIINALNLTWDEARNIFFADNVT